MALQKQIVSIPLGRGIDTKTDSKLVSTDKLLGLANGRVGDANLKKRFGYEEESVITVQASSDGSSSTTGELTKGSALGAFDKEVLLADGNTLYSFSSSTNEWIDKGVNIGIGVGKKVIQRNNNDLKYADSAYFSGILFTVYYDVDDSDYRITVKDYNTGVSYLNDVTIEASTGSYGYCKAIYLNGAFYAFYVDGSDLKYVKVNLSNLSQFVSAVTLVSSGASPRFDIIPLSASQAFLTYSDASNQTIIGVFTASTGVLATQTISKDSTQSTYAVLDSFSSNIFVFFSGTDTTEGKLEYGVYDFGLNEVLAPTQIVVANGAKIARIVGAVREAGKCEVYYELESKEVYATDSGVTGDTINVGEARFRTGTKINFVAATTAPTGLTSGNDYYMIETGTAGVYEFATTEANALNGVQVSLSSTGSGVFTLTKLDGDSTNYIIWATVQDDGTTSLNQTVATAVTLASKAVVIENDIVFAVEWFSDLQPTTFLLLHTPDRSIVASAVAKCNVNRGKGLLDVPILPNLFAIGSDRYALANSEKIRIEVEDSDFTFENGIVLNEFLIDRAQRYFNEQIGKNTIFGGGIVKAYDGKRATELNFNVWPEKVVAAHLGSGGSISAGDYGFQAVYRWIDNQGLIHRSAPSLTVSVTASGGSSTINVGVPNLTLTDKTASVFNTEVIIELYMTTTNGSLFYLKSTAENDPTKLYTYFSITTEVSGSEELIYTTGGVLENLAPPPSILVKATKNRVFLVNSENPKEFYYSKIAQNQFGLGFNDILANQIQEGVNEIEMLEAMDDKVVFGSKSKLHFISGDGPNDLGLNNTFTEPQLINNQVGCTNPDSTVFFTQGIAFQSPNKGWWLLSRNLDLQYIGADVEGYKDLTTVSANLIEDKNEIRFATSEGTQLVYDYYRQQWAVDSGLPANDAIYQNDSYYLLRNADGIVWKETSSFTDNGGPIRMAVETPWIKLANVQGFQRIKRMAVLGKFKSAHKLRIQIAYDYEEFYREELTFDAGTIIGTSLFGDDATFGDDTVFGGTDDGVYQFRLHLPRQKCQSIKFKFEDISESSPGEALELTALDLEVGVKKGLNKLRADKSI